MKACARFFILIILIAFSGCKKDRDKNKPDNLPPSPPVTVKKWIVTTVAGNGTASFVNGLALSATFHFPEDVVIDQQGNFYVTDVLNFCVRKALNGQVSTFAGGNGSGIINANGLLAQFKNPYSIAIDENGNLYSTDENDPRIRKISPAGDVTTYAGTETMGFKDGGVEVAKFGLGNSITTDTEGNVYVADAMNSRIRKISVSGQVTTIAGTGEFGFKDGNGSIAQFASPGGIAVDRLGNLYVADRANFRIRKITTSGVVSTLAGKGVAGNNNGNAAEATFSSDLHDIVIDSAGNLYVEDENRIRMITPEGIVSTIAGSSAGYKDGEGSNAKFNFPAGLGIDAQGNIYVADLINNRIRKISLE